jgi:hypothetical protein
MVNYYCKLLARHGRCGGHRPPRRPGHGHVPSQCQCDTVHTMHLKQMLEPLTGECILLAITPDVMCVKTLYCHAATCISLSLTTVQPFSPALLRSFPPQVLDAPQQRTIHDLQHSPLSSASHTISCLHRQVRFQTSWAAPLQNNHLRCFQTCSSQTPTPNLQHDPSLIVG